MPRKASATTASARAAAAPATPPPIARPKAPAVEFPTRPDPAVRWVWALRGLGYGLVVFLFLAGGPLLGIVGSLSDSIEEVLAGLAIGFAAYLVVCFAAALVYAVLAVPRYTFEVRDEEVVVRRGILFRTTSRIPLRKVQDIHVKQGPILRAFGLASLKLETAGGNAMRWGGWGTAAEGQLPGLRDAEALADHLMARVKALRADL